MLYLEFCGTGFMIRAQLYALTRMACLDGGRGGYIHRWPSMIEFRGKLSYLWTYRVVSIDAERLSLHEGNL